MSCASSILGTTVLFCLELVWGRCMDSYLCPIFEPTPTPKPTLPIALIACALDSPAPQKADSPLFSPTAAGVCSAAVQCSTH
ncbi:uncharacterized protein LY79DRAFT_543211 [Colletotrichum navitas]|uniref:Secreted protein n=1 Tax=Colletotrichum navitas TaxID=681940 RepID=A0AAD8Q9E7_9PEZI|nr:uncharacterized protein LY79DRAFT_543211 [Colletotrichum navitas]KAK1596939.1 hypothetical protein LY79DRAFT_543211 [Colletotrichum navitas]